MRLTFSLLKSHICIVSSTPFFVFFFGRLVPDAVFPAPAREDYVSIFSPTDKTQIGSGFPLTTLKVLFVLKVAKSKHVHIQISKVKTAKLCPFKNMFLDQGPLTSFFQLHFRVFMGCSFFYEDIICELSMSQLGRNWSSCSDEAHEIWLKAHKT